MDYRDTRSSARAQLKSNGKKRSGNKFSPCHWKCKGHSVRGWGDNKGIKAGRCTAGEALRRSVRIDVGLQNDTALDEKMIKVPQSSAEQWRFVEEYERETERYLRRDDRAGFDAEPLERLDRGERLEGSSGCCETVDEWSSTVTEEFDMLDLSSCQSVESASEDGWAIVPEVG